MPDKWEYPWYAAWDLAFHTTALALVDFDFAKKQLSLMLRSLDTHPNGQMPAYEWNFGDVNPPVHAWATVHLFHMERNLGREDVRFLERSFHALNLNFNWWLNRKDPEGRNVFAGGFLGLDNIGVFDRSAPLPTGGSLEQADGTAWMAFYCQTMIEMALILADHDRQYEEYAFRFIQQFMWIASAMNRIGEGQDQMWDEEDGFHYDVLRLPDGSATRLKVRSLVGLFPLCASTIFEPDTVTTHPRLMEQRGLEVHVLDRVEKGSKPELVRQLGATYHSGKVTDLGFEPDVIVECTGVGQVITDAVKGAAAGGIVCLTGVGSGGRTIGVVADLAAEMVLQNNVVVGSVNANKRHWYKAGEALARADVSWLSRLVTRRERPEEFMRALAREPDDIKVVVQFGEA